MAGVRKAMRQSAANPVSNVTTYTLGVNDAGTTVTLTANTVQANCDILDMRGVRSLAVKPVSSGSAITTLTFYGCDTPTGTFVLINDLGSSGVVSVTDSRWAVVTKTTIEPHHFIQIQPDQNGTVIVVAKN